MSAMTEETGQDEPQTAMLLTEQEWDDLSAMVGHYRSCTSWTENERQRLSAGQDHLTMLDRRRALALRIIEAT